MSTNLATILVGLGYDLSALEKGAPDAFRLINEQTLGMSAEMKRASREGAESWRLIDEALGIHISRPLTRIVTQEFPAFASALQSVLGAGVIGALGVAGFEFFDKIASSIEKARAAQEAFAQASEKTNTVFEDVMQSYEKADKLRSLSGLNLQLFKIDSSSMDEARKHIDELTASFEDMIKKQVAASGFFTSIGASIGNEISKLYHTPTEQAAEALGKQFGEFQSKFDQLAKIDALKGTHDSAAYLTAQLTTARTLLEEMSSHRMGTVETFLRNQIPTTQTGQFGYSAQEIEREQQFVDLLTKVNELQKAAADNTSASENDARAAAALERQQAAAKDLDDLYRSIGESMNTLVPQTDPLKKLADEIHLMRYKAEEEFKELGKNTDDALELRAAQAALKTYEANLDRVFAKAKAEADVIDAMAKLPTKIAATGTAPAFASTAAGPTLGAGGSVGEQLDTFLKDQNAQLKLAAQAYQDIITPQQKYQLAQQELGTLLEKGLIDQTAYTAALQKARDEMAKTADQMQKLLEKGGASGGFQAFWMQLEGQGGKNGTGQFTFDLLNKGLQGFEDQTAAALTGAKTHWMSFFESLDQMALKFMLNKLISGLLTGPLGNLFGGGGGAGGSSFGPNMDAGEADMFNVPGYASGTDSAPGGLSWVGEDGPELLNLPAGSSVTPMSRMGGMTVPIHIDARGGEIGVEEKIARALSASAPHMIMRAVVEMGEVQKRSLNQR